MYPFLLGYPKITELLTFVCTVRNSKNESHINQNILEPGKKKKKVYILKQEHVECEEAKRQVAKKISKHVVFGI